MTFTPVTVTLNGFLFDSLTPDPDGVLWSWQSLDGWFDTAQVRQESSERQSMGMNVTVSRRNGRPISLTAIASSQNTGARLDDLLYKAMRRLKANCDLSAGVGLLQVAEPGLGLQAYVRGTGPILSRVFGHRHGVTFQVPLLAADPRRYSSTLTTNATLVLTGSGTVVTQTLANAGDLPTPPVFTIVGPAVNPYVRSNTGVTGLGFPFVQYNGTLAGGQTLTIDMANLTADVNGTNVIALLTGIGGGPPDWWQINAGGTSVNLGRASGSGTCTATAVYRDAYS